MSNWAPNSVPDAMPNRLAQVTAIARVRDRRWEALPGHDPVVKLVA
jgi:hypothetical protein